VGQIRDTLDNNKTVWEEVSGGLDILRIGDYEIASRAYIGRFNFKRSRSAKACGELSGGERNRLQLAKILQIGANVSYWMSHRTT
jgi:ATPase subunit of ABC transporter with duplicated ATPase domains